MVKLNRDNIKIALQGLAMVIICIVTLAASSIVQNIFNQRRMHDEATRRAEDQLEATNLRITNVMDQVETALRNNTWGVRNRLDRPDSLWGITRRIVEANEFVAGSSISMKEFYFPGKGRLFAPYTYRAEDRIESTQLGTPDYNYPPEAFSGASVRARA